ncbi:TonB-dependent siderophore receptor [Limnohabitans sp. yimb22184]|uniref:TonB-dependent siderophore receptor n=1 Tax=Limnohabitans sp. YIMB22184 TaxID=3374104 RepID=UPI003A8C08EA
MAFFSPFSRRASARFTFRTNFRATHIASAIALLALGCAHAQSVTEITITETAPSQVSGFGDVPLSKAPFSAVTIDRQTLQDIGAQRVSDALRLDASVADSYNSPAYWDMLSVRGYTLDNRYNYRREGLPISAETMIPMDNKERIELFKGTSGIQAGTSAPGGLVNYVVKRPPSAKNETIRSVSASYGTGQSSGAGLDLGGRLGQDQALGYRFNAAYENLDPYIRNSEGHRKLFALAMDWRISPDSKLEWEIERSERQQIGVNGSSLWDGAIGLPAVVDPKTNLTRQAWSVPGFFAATTGSIRFKQAIDQGWLWSTQYGAQKLRTDDRLSFAFGCGGNCDRFYADGSFDIYDYRSDNERRLTEALQTSLAGQLELAGLTHNLTFSAMRSRQLDRLQATQQYSYAGTSTATGSVVPAQVLDQTYPNTNRSEYSTEISVMDRMTLSTKTAAWFGLRHTQSDRNTLSLDTANPNPKSQSSGFTTPWIALSHEYINGSTMYASYGEGVELLAAPNNANYINAGQFLGVQRSKQIELGAKGKVGNALSWSAALFHIERPAAYDYAGERVVDGTQRHQGLDAGLQWHHQQWLLAGQAQWVDARISGASLNTDLNGSKPLNVPALTLRAIAQYRFTDVPGLRTSLRLSHEGSRRVTENGSINLPSWNTLDFATHYDTRIQGTRTEWTLAIDNLADRHYWRESPKQFGHYYLYPGAPRTVRVGVKASF